MIKTILFDMDGVLIDTEPVYSQCLQEALAQTGVYVSLEEIYALAGMEFRQKFDILLGRRGLDPDRDQLAQRYRQSQARHLLDFGPMAKSGNIEVLQRLRDSGWKLVLCSNSSQERVDKVFADTGMTGLFDLIITGETVPRRKPAPDIYLRALEVLGIGPGECIVVEDSVYGIQAAKAAGLRVIAVLDRRFPYIENSADATITALPQLFALLEGLV